MKDTKFEDKDFIVPTLSTKNTKLKRCVSVASNGKVIAVRNSNDVDKDTVFFANEEWQVFIECVRKGEFDFKA